MLTKIEVTKMYWIGVNSEQMKDLLQGVIAAIDAEKERASSEKVITMVQFEALNSLREALLSI